MRGVVVVCAAAVSVAVGRGVFLVWLVIEDDDFVDAEDGEGASDRTGEVGLLVVGLCVGDDGAGNGDGECGFAGACGVEDGGWFGCVGFGIWVIAAFSFLRMVDELRLQNGMSLGLTLSFGILE